MLAAGLMSGTSLDGIDVVICEITGIDLETEIKQIAFETFPIPEIIKNKIRICSMDELIKPSMLTSLNFELGEIFARAIINLCNSVGIESKSLDFIASHGQTIFHQPFLTSDTKPSTLQLGESAVISTMCECPVVSDFRVMDMANGGQGAPLVPYPEFILYSKKDKNRALQNIGGIGNMTVLPKNSNVKDIIAFDTGPGNMMIDEAMSILFNKTYDHYGEVASAGKLIPSLQNFLIKHDYLRLPIPKTTGREIFGKIFVEEIISKYSTNSATDLITTITWFTAYCIEFHYSAFIKPKVGEIDELIISGGGSHNKAIISFLKDMFPTTDVLTQEALGYSSDAKEAIAFVILGNQTLHKQPSNIPSATGANKLTVLGKIQYL
jgi:anhydro-N-acetylmuramic acid kinase